MKKVFAILAVCGMMASLAFSMGGAQDGKKSGTVKMFQIKVEIKDAIDAYAAAYSAAHPESPVKVETLGGGGDYAGALKAKLQSGQMPDIFVITGQGEYNTWKDYIADLSDQPRVQDTDVAFNQNGKVYGFPVAVEGFGLAYNAEILKKAGIDPSTLTTRKAYEKAFKLLDSKKAELGLNAVVSMAASVAGNMWWSIALHNFSCYWGGGLAADDTSVIQAGLKGKVDEARFMQYAKYVQLLFKYADKKILQNGSYDEQVAAFAQGKTAFLHQGNWVDPNLKQLGASFEMGYAPHAFLDAEE